MRTIISIITLAFLCAPAIAAEAPAETTAEANWFEQNFYLILTVVMGILTGLGLISKFREYLLDKLGQNKAKLVDAALSAVTETYHEYVKDIKAKKQDGKLTKDEAKNARDMALNKLKNFAKAEGINVAKAVGEAALPALIEKAVNAMKKSAKDAKEQKE